MSSPNHDHLAHLKIPLESVLSATNNFADANFSFETISEKTYDGQLLWSGELIDINARRFIKEYEYSDEQFWTEVLTLSGLSHQNLISFVGFCDENGEKIVINKNDEKKGSLCNYLSDSFLLTWVQRLKISLGLAHALSYIYYDESRDFSVIHCNIDSAAVVLNDNWEAKLSRFECSMKVAASERHHSFNIDIFCTEGYTDPTYEKTESVHHKSDMYSFGIVMFEVLCGRDSVIDEDYNKYLAPLAITHYREKKLNEIIDWDLWKQMDSQSFNLFAEIAYDCLNEERSQRPSIDEIVPRLEKVLELQQRHENARMSSRIHDLAHLKIPLQSILSATNNFDDKNVVSRGGVAKHYMGKLSWYSELIEITARKFNKDRDEMFWNEVSILSSLKHQNLVSLVGFCDENGEKIIIIRCVIKGSLDIHLSDAMLLPWVQRLKISVGLAHVLSYIHYDEPRDFSVIHREITSKTVLLDDNSEPKLSCFSRSMKTVASQRHHSFQTNKVWSSYGYADPTNEKAKSVNHKTDMYSFGIVLFELLCGRESIIANDTNKSLAVEAILHYREKKLDVMIDPNLWEQMDPVSFTIFSETAYDCLNEERSQRPNIDEIVPRLEKALELQLAPEIWPIMSSPKDLSYLRVPLEKIVIATNNFAEENLFSTSTGFAQEYKGQLMWSGELINVTARRLNKEWKHGEQQFWMEIFMLSSLKHKNMVSIVGFCDESDEKIIIINRNETKGWLTDYLSDPMLLTWVRRLEICVCIAHALSYVHYDEHRDFCVIHRKISSGTVLLNDDWEPKLTNFECSMLIKASQRDNSFSNDLLHYTYGYVDPTYLETSSVNQKSDMYSFGIVLFELLCGRKAITVDEQDNKYLDPVATFHYREKILNDIIDPDLWKQMDPQSFNIFAEAAYDCLNKERSQRPNIDNIVTRLEKALKVQLERETVIRDHSRISAKAEDTSSAHQKGKSLKHLKIGLKEIELATDTFAEKFCIGSGGFGNVYKAQLEHFDSSNSSSTEGDNKCDLPKKRSTVAIKHIFNPKGEQGFGTEIETLTSCKHDNIISLLGFCDEGLDNMILIYEYATRGSLEDFIQSNDKKSNLTWVQRIRICINIAHGLKYIHTNTDDKQKIIHRDIKSANILLSESLEAKIADFGLSKIHPESQEASTINASTIAGTDMYLDPEYEKSGKLNKKSDIYSFGVVLFEILTGTLAYDRNYIKVNKKGIAPIARHHFESGTLMEIVDQRMKEEGDGHVFSLSKGPNRHSLDIFFRIAYCCLAETQAQRPTIDYVIEELKKVLEAEEKSQKDNIKMSLEDINLATQNFSDDNLIGKGGFGNLYKGDVDHANARTSIAAKRLDKALFGVGETSFFRELDIPLKYKHENVIGLVGYCDEEVEKIIVHEFASRGSLDEHLSDASLTWLLRLKICLDIASGLNFLHATDINHEVLIHRDIKSSNILLFDDWKAKIIGFGLSIVCPLNQNIDYVVDDVVGTIGYTDPLCSKTGSSTKESDVFSLGAVLFDILCGKQSSVKLNDEYLFLPFLAKYRYQVGKLDELVFEGIKEQIEPQSFIVFARIAYQCLHHKRERRPTTGEVVLQLKRAFEIQEDYEIWEPKLPTDYKEIIEMSNSPHINSTKKKEELYSNFSEGILLQQDKVLLSLDSSGERSEMVSSTTFLYTNSCPYNSQSLPKSRFGTVVEMLDISYLNIEIKANTQFLSPSVDYGAFLVFKFCDLRDLSSKPVYVNLKYKKGRESLHAYFATKRDNDWMMIELDRYSNQNEDGAYKFLLESFSPYYRGHRGVYIEGIEFRAIDKVKHEKYGKLKNVQQVLKSNISVDQVKQLPTKMTESSKIYKNYDEHFWLGKVNGKKLLMVSAKGSLHISADTNNFALIPSSQSRFKKVIELLPQNNFQIKCTVKSQMLSLDTEYVCYLVFKLSKKCQGLHCPVKVRDVLHQQNNEAGYFYFTTPSPLNILDITRIPKQRKDGWMEIQVSKFNSTLEFKDDSLSILLNFESLDGTMSGLIVRGLEFWPM